MDPSYALVYVFITALVYTLIFIMKGTVGHGSIAMVAWWVLAGAWFFINPVGYAVAYFFLGIGFFLLASNLILIVRQLRVRRGYEMEEEE